MTAEDIVTVQRKAFKISLSLFFCKKYRANVCIKIRKIRERFMLYLGQKKEERMGKNRIHRGYSNERERIVGSSRIGILFCCGMLLGMTGCQKKEALLYVNGEAVQEEEMALLEEDARRAVQMKVLQQWAEECEGVEHFSYENMLRQMEEENQSRAEQKAAGEVIYGIPEYTPLQYYNDQMGNYERLLKEEISRSAPEEELLDYYEEHIEEYRQVGEIQAELSIREDGRVISEQEISLDAYNYRTLSEQNEELVAALVELPEGEVKSWLDEYGMEWTLLCTGREEDTYEPFADVRGAVLEQYATEQLKLGLEERIQESTVEDLR